MFCPGKWNAIRRDESAETSTTGKIIIPDSAKDSRTPFRGVVSLAGVDNQWVQQDDVVRFDRVGTQKDGFTETINGIQYAFVKEEYIIMVENRDAFKPSE
jgi:co-chaperonin GroES (HSP10)